MQKVILNKEEYTFNPVSNSITFVDTIKLEHILIITDITNNSFIYNFACEGYGGTLSGKVLTLDVNVTALPSTTELQIIKYIDTTSIILESNEYLDEIRKHTRTLESIAELLTIQNELIKEIL